MSDFGPNRSRRRRIAGESSPQTAASPPAATEPAPANKAPAQKASASKTSAATPTAKESPAKKQPAKKQPAKKQPAKKQSTTKEPAAKKAAAESTSTTGAKASKVAAARTAKNAPSRTTAGPARATTTTGSTAGAGSSAMPILALALALIVLVGGGVTAVLGFQRWDGGGAAGDRDAAVKAATDAAETIFSFNYDELEQHERDSKALMTSKFATEFDKVAPALDDLAPQRKVEVTAIARDAATLPCGDECSVKRASVLVFLDQDRRIADDGTSTVFGNRIVVTVVQRGGDWKVDDIRAV